MKNLLLGGAILLCFSLFLPQSHGQDGEMAASKEEKSDDGPVFITITTSHWNWDCDECEPDRWLELEQEWFDNVTSKNEFIIGSAVFNHLYSEDNSEVIFLNVYPSWDAIDDAGRRNGELAKEAWDEEEGKAWGKERSSYYSNEHSDEIMYGLPNYKPLTSIPEEPLVFYVQSRQLSFENEWSEENAEALAEFHEKVTHQNPLIKAYYPHRHAWGADGREVQQVYVLESMEAVENMWDEQQRLIEENWPDKEARKAFFKTMPNRFTPWHSDRLYLNVPSLHKLTLPPGDGEETMD